MINEDRETRMIKESLAITGRGTIIVVQCLPSRMNASNTQVLIQERALKIFAIEQSHPCGNVIGVVLGSQISKEEIQVGSSVEFVLTNETVKNSTDIGNKR